jgi:pyrrolidone-carboxylate peptidase
MTKILVTAFEPFGLSGQLRQRNASSDILELLQHEHNYEFLKLPVAKSGLQILEEKLDTSRPSAILAMGEDLGMLPNGIRLEPFAYDASVTTNPLGHIGKKSVSSPFAKAALPDNAPCGIGTYYCNGIYKTALDWASRNGNQPVGFIHVAVLGARKTQKKKVAAILDLMKIQIGHP